MRYYVIGADGQRYGPVDMVQLQQWVHEGRVVRTTMLVEEMSGQQYAANVVEGLNFPMAQQGPVGDPMGSQYYNRPGMSPNFPYDPRPAPNTTTSIVLAIFSMVCCGCLPLGIAALIYAIQANGAATAGNISEAYRLDDLSRKWSYWSIGIGIPLQILLIIANISQSRF